jgi:LmbE family N-acetylglucosaminyl deacetylase
MRVLALAPHPDDEVLGAGATLLGLAGDGWEVVVRGVTLGSDPERRDERAAEAREACRRLGFVWRAPAEEVWHEPWDLVVSPHPEDDRHPAHAAAGREAAAHASGPWWRWALWGELTAPNRLVPFGPATLELLDGALAAHASELGRGLDLHALLRARAELAAVRGPELVHGFGTARASAEPYAELLDCVG